MHILLNYVILKDYILWLIIKLYGPTMLDDNLHFSKKGHEKSFEYIYNNYIYKK